LLREEPTCPQTLIAAVTPHPLKKLSKSTPPSKMPGKVTTDHFLFFK